MPQSVTQRNGVFADPVFTRPNQDESLACSILVVGGSTGAYSATLTALKLGLDVCLAQPQKVVGGQFTAQALPASDDGDLLKQKATLYQVSGEEFAISRAQRQFRDRQRVLQQVNGRIDPNPGGGWVSPLSTTPVVAATAMNEAIAPYLANDKLKLIPYAEPIQVLMDEHPDQPRRVKGIVFKDAQADYTFTVIGKVVIEATDLGDLLELGDIESRVGQESRSETGEAILPEDARPQCQQSFTFDVLVERTLPGGGVSVGAPPGYAHEAWLNINEFTDTFWVQRQGKWRPRNFFSDFGIFRYRRVKRTDPYEKAIRPGDITVINWGVSTDPDRRFFCGNEYRPDRLVGVSREERKQHLQRGRDRARAYIHFLQSNGIPDLKPRGDLTWTDDGIALEPYIREARRGVALTTIRHEDIAKSFFPENTARARAFEDSVGIGQYHYLDLHGNDVQGHVTPIGKDVLALPFTLSIKALAPINTDGLILSSKSIGVSHIANAVYRMHPIEWAIGEASGMLAVFSVWTGREARDLATDEAQIRKIQAFLTRNGIPIYWFDDISHNDPDFEAIQVMAAASVIRSEDETRLSFRPYARVNRAVAATALMKLLGLETQTPPSPTFRDVRPEEHWAYNAIETLYANGLIVGVGHGQFAPDQPITRQQLSFLIKKAMPDAYDRAFARTPKDRQILQRRELSRVFYELLKTKLGIG